MEEEYRREIEETTRRLESISPYYATIVLNYIHSQLNANSMIGMINPYQYKSLFIKTIKGLFRVIFFKEVYDENNNLVKESVSVKMAVFYAGFTYVGLLYSRPLHSIDKTLAELEKRAGMGFVPNDVKFRW